jgi:type I restriction enzyme M protein
MSEQAFKNIDDVLRKEAGCTTELDYTEQTSWLLFLKYLDALEQDKALVLFFEKGAPTRKVWYYQLDPGRNLGKTNPLNDDDLKEFVELQKTFADSPKSWSMDVTGIDTASYDLSVKNPNGGEVVSHRTPREIMDEIAALDAESGEVLARIRGLL